MKWPPMVRWLAVVLAALCPLSGSTANAQTAYLFAYFMDPGSQGMYLALSRDGHHWTPLNNGQPWVKPEQSNELMRDVFLTRGPDHKYYMVWTWGWQGQALGYAESPDLIHWSAQRQIPIMQDFPGTRNVWAPEIYWDEKQSKWLIIWSSSIGESGPGHRIYSAFTADFNSFSKPSVFFDPGFVVIDATIFRGGQRYYLVFKDQTLDPLRMQIRYATGPTLEGPWTRIHEPITESWSEGPSVIQAGREFVVYYEHYRAPLRYEGVQSTDWIHWQSINDKISFPAHCKHGSFLEIGPEDADRLLAHHATAPR